MHLTRLSIATGGLLALTLAAPGSALARKSHVHGHHRVHAHHSKARTVRLAAVNPTAPVTTAPSANPATVSSFKDGVLTLKLADGSTLTGKVTPKTEIQCTSAPPATTPSTPSTPTTTAPSPTPPVLGDGQGDEGEHQHGNQDDGDKNDGENDAASTTTACDSSALVAGAAVREAVLRVGSDGTATFKQIDIVK